ncbi:MAG: DUF3570 domain-containing protein [Polyangiaceae bacterium]
MRFRRALAVAGATWLALTSAHAEGPSERSGLVVDATTEIAGYADTDHVSVFTPSVGAQVRDPLAGWSARGNYLVDIVSAASVDIVSSASSRWTEVRHAGGLSATYKPDTFGVTASGSISREPDYLSLSGGGSLSLELFDKSVTPSLGYTFTHDTAGRTGTPFSVYSLELNRHTITGTTAIVVNRDTALNVGGDVIVEVGHQEKPYRYLPVFAPDVAPRVPTHASVEAVNGLRLPGRVAERLPTTRQRYAMSLRLAQRLSDSTFVISERLYTDSWGLRATTTDLRLVFDLSRRVYLWPHLRAHFQNGVSFWKLAYSADVSAGSVPNVPLYRTGDRELSPLSTGTLGGGLHWNLGSSAAPSRFSLQFLAEGAVTAFHDALYIDQRLSGLLSTQLEIEL